MLSRNLQSLFRYLDRPILGTLGFNIWAVTSFNHLEILMFFFGTLQEFRTHMRAFCVKLEQFTGQLVRFRRFWWNPVCQSRSVWVWELVCGWFSVFLNLIIQLCLNPCNFALVIRTCLLTRAMSLWVFYPWIKALWSSWNRTGVEMRLCNTCSNSLLA